MLLWPALVGQAGGAEPMHPLADVARSWWQAGGAGPMHPLADVARSWWQAGGAEPMHPLEDVPGPENYRVNPTDMFHLVGLTLDELGGLSLINHARNAIGRQLAAVGFGDDFFGNSAVPSGWFEHPGEMSEEAQARFLQAVQDRHGGAGKRFRIGVLEEGKWNASGVTPKDALLIDSLKWGVRDVARFFSIPSHRLGDDARTSFASQEQENRSYFDTTLGKWVSRLEAEANEKLFSEAEKDADSHFAEFLQDALFKADMAARHQAYATAIQWGWMSRNEVRARENLNPYEGGDEYLTPLNMQTGEEEEEE